MSTSFAYYHQNYGYFAHRIEKVGLLKGAEAMYFKGNDVPCTENITEGWYYDEKNKEFITQQQFEDNRKKYETPGGPWDPIVNKTEIVEGSALRIIDIGILELMQNKRNK